MTPHDGGSAFPVLDSPDGNCLYCREAGMSLRDYFAAAALQGDLAGDAGEITGVMSISWVTTLAHRAYTLADAMLAARQKTSPKE